MENKKRINKTAVILCAAFVTVLFICAAVILYFNIDTPLTATADMYKDFAVFDCWQNAYGDVVSKDNHYSYNGKRKDILKPVYTELNVVPNNKNGDSRFLSGERIYINSGEKDFGRANIPLRFGVSVAFSISGGGSFGIFGDARQNAESGLNLGSNGIFCPEFNFNYSAEGGVPYSVCAADNGGAIKRQEYTSWKISADKPHVFRLVFGDCVKMYIDGIEFSDENFSCFVPDYAENYYLAFSGKNAKFKFTEWDLIENSAAETYGIYLGTDAYAGKKITFLGDSITIGPGAHFDDKKFSTLLSKALSAIQYNMGISGTVLCTGHEERPTRLYDVEKIPLDSSAVVVLLGTNDFYQAKKNFAALGKFGSKDTSTIYGAMDALCVSLKERFKDTDTEIYIFTPIPRANDLSNTGKCKNGYTLRELSCAYKEVCRYHGIPCFDLNGESGMGAEDFRDTLHPNEAGSIKIYEYMYARLVARWYYF